MTLRKAMDHALRLNDIGFRFGELQCLLNAAGFEDIAMQLGAIHQEKIDPVYRRMCKEDLAQHFPSVFPEAQLEVVPGNGIYKGDAR